MRQRWLILALVVVAVFFMLKPNVASLIADAIQIREGWYGGSASFRYNNPGNLEAGPGMTGTVTLSTGHVEAIFPSYSVGRAALLDLVQQYLTGENPYGVGPRSSLQDFFATYDSPQTAYSYAAAVADYLSVHGVSASPETQLAAL